MRNQFALFGIIFVLGATSSFAEWKTLKNSTGQIVEVIVDFEIENLRIDAAGSTAFAAKAQIDGDDIGFLISISKPKEREIEFSQRRSITIMEEDVDITSSGEATRILERKLNAQLGIDGNDPQHVVGRRNGSSPFLGGAAQIAHVMVVYAYRLHGITYDEKGREIPGECFGLDLMIDAPLKRFTAHFYTANYSGTLAHNRARDEWFRLQQDKPAK